MADAPEPEIPVLHDPSERGAAGATKLTVCSVSLSAPISFRVLAFSPFLRTPHQSLVADSQGAFDAAGSHAILVGGDHRSSVGFGVARPLGSR